MAENLIAALIGSSIASLKYSHKGRKIVFQAWVSGFFLSFFASRDVATIVNLIVGIKVSYGASFFLTAYFGALMLEKGAHFIRVQEWKK